MAKKYTATVVLDGDSSGAVESIKLTKKQLELLTKTQRENSKSSQDQEKKSSALASALKVMIPAATVGGLASIAKRSLDAADQIQKLSSRIGASTEALSEYRHVAELSGVQFDALTMAWQRQTRRISEAASGTGEARNALKELGLQASELNKLKPEEQFERLTEALNQVPNQADRVRLAMKLWDAEGVKLVQITNQGSEAIKQYREEARQLGKSISQDQADAAARANDEMTRLSSSFGGLAETLTLKLAPGFADTLGWINKILQADDPFERIRNSVSDLIADMTGLAEAERKLAFDSNPVNVYNKKIIDLTNKIFEYQRIIGEIDVQTEHGMNQYKAYAKVIAKLEIEVAKLRGTYKEVNKDIGQHNKKTDEAEQKTSAVAKVTEKYTTNIKESSDAHIRLYEEIKKEEKALDDLILSVDHVERAQTEYNKTISDLKKELDNENISLERYLELTEMAGGIVWDAAETTSDAADKTASAWEKAAERIDQSMVEMWRNGLDGLDDFKAGFVDTIKDMMAEAAHAMITRPLIANIQAVMSGGQPAGGMFGDIGGGLSSLLGGQQIGAGISGIGTALGTDLFSGAGGVANWQYGLAGLGGGLLGGAIGGDTGGMLGGLGATIGMATPLGPLGAVLGSLAGGALGSIFGGDDTAYATWATRPTGTPISTFEDDVAVQSAFGVIGLLNEGSKNIKAEEFRKALEAIGQIDDAIAAAFGPEATARVQEALSDWTEQDRKADDFSERMVLRLREIVGALDFEFADLIDMDAAGSIEDMVAQLNALKTLSDFIASDSLADHIQAVNNAALTMRDRMRGSTDSMLDMIAAYDGSIDATQQLAGATAARYQAEMQYLAQIGSMQQSVNDMLQGSIDNILLSVMDTGEQYEHYTQRAEGLAAALETMTDPEQISDITKQIDRLTGQAYALLDEQQRQEVSGEFVDFLGGVMDVANERLEAARSEAVSSSQMIRDAMFEAINAAGSRLQGAADSAGGALVSASSAIAGAASLINGAAGNISRASASYEVG